MLYDPKWEQKTKADPTKPSIEGFIAWLERQNAKTSYEYYPCATCAIGQYFISIGSSYREQCCYRGPTMIDAICLWNEKITAPKPHTFGAALERARAEQQS